MRLPDPEKSRVALVGTAVHGRSDLPDLPAVAHNLSALATTFADSRYGAMPGAHIRVLLNSSRPHATGVEIMAAAEEARDVIVVYLAGHVLLAPAGDPQLALARAGERGRIANLDLTWVARSIAASPALTKVLIADVVVAGPEKDAQGRDAAHTLVELLAAIDGISMWLYAAPNVNTYTNNNGPCTSFTAAILDIVHRPTGRPVGFDLEFLHGEVHERLRRDSLPLPRLWTGAGVGRHRRSTTALFYQTGQPAVRADIDQLKELLADAGRAERNYHRPEAVVDAFRAVVVSASRVLGPDHVRTMQARRQLAHWVGRAGEIDSAVRLFRQLHTDQQRVLGPGHHDTVGTADDISYWAQRRKA